MAKKKKLGDRARAFVDDYTRDLTARDLQRVFTRETRDMVAFFTQGTDQAEVTQKDLLRHPFRHARQFFLAFAMRLTAARRLLYAGAIVLFVFGLFDGMTPEAGEPMALSAVPLPDDPTDDRGPGVRIDVADTRGAGVYRLSWEEGPLGAREDVFAANPDPRESLLERIEAGDVKKLMQPLNVEVVAAKGVESFGPTGREIWRDLALALFVMLVVEAAFAAWVSRSR